ncbi:hypothetical protein [Tissierella sp.]|uniref:hypothetical protein n=1 Tax=Tissierella sp. TaxID=41274 RepID=UPI00285B7088|nr:hypothetical protein [Tissierella sp.]MDR7855201.1 hypothetical protein [Tissierella sp.]
MIYTCKDCGFLFYRIGVVKVCPFCEKINVRLANKEESQKLRKLMEQGKTSIQIKEEKTL